MIDHPDNINEVPVKVGHGQEPVFVGDVGHAEDAAQIQQNIVRINGQRSVYIPVMKQGSGSNTIAIVDGVAKRTADNRGMPKGMKLQAIFSQSTYILDAIESARA